MSKPGSSVWTTASSTPSCWPAAGLKRLGLESRIDALLDPDVSLPAVGQGVIGIECRTDDRAARDVVQALDDAPASAAVSAERAFARRLGGSCQSPIAAFAEIDAAGRLTLQGLVAEPDGSRLIRDTIAGAASRGGRARAIELAERVLAAGAGELLERLAQRLSPEGHGTPMLPLEGIGVLITRPSHQAASLGRLFEAEGAAAVFFPAIEIRPLADARTSAARLGCLEHFELIIFSSANAVRFGAALLDQRRDLPLAAIGPATARALNQAGYRVSVQPPEGFDSESLLRHPRLRAGRGPARAHRQG